MYKCGSFYASLDEPMCPPSAHKIETQRRKYGVLSFFGEQDSLTSFHFSCIHARGENSLLDGAATFYAFLFALCVVTEIYNPAAESTAKGPL